jgi:hypothetical protein
MLAIPLQAVPSQIVNVQLAGQDCDIHVRQLSTGLFVDLYVNDALIIGGVVALDANLIVRDAYLGFIGDLAFFDTKGASDPVYTGLAGQYALLWIAPGDVTVAT